MSNIHLTKRIRIRYTVFIMMQPVVLRLSEEDKRLLELEAKKKGVSMAEVGRKAITTYLAKVKKEKPSGAEVLLKWALRTDKPKKRTAVTSQNYKQYLYGPKSPKFGYLWRSKK